MEDLIDIEPAPQAYKCPEPPSSSDEPKTLNGWQDLLQDRHVWASDVTRDMKDIVLQIQDLDGEASAVQRSAAIAVENIKQHVAGLRPRYMESKDWADKVLEDQTFLLNRWSAHLDQLLSIPVNPELVQLIKLPSIDSAKSKVTASAKGTTTLYDLVFQSDTSSMEQAAQDASQGFEHRVRDLTEAFEGVVWDGGEVVEGFSHAIALSDSEVSVQVGRLCEEVEVIARKIATDNEHAQELSSTPKALSQLSKVATLQTKNFLPSIRDTTIDIDEALQRVTERKNLVMKSAARSMQQVSMIESRISQIHTKLATLDEEIDGEHSFDTLSTIMRLPNIYGSLLVECVQRQEWNAKMKADLSSLAEETATYKDEETKRRRKWVATMGGAVDSRQSTDASLGLEINVADGSTDTISWPSMTREDIDQYIRGLETHGLNEARDEVVSLAKALDQPSKAQSRRAKAFKHGSLQEGFGKNSLILRGDDDILDELRASKSRLEDKIKSSDSRVRKLEALLHRQSQMSKPSVVSILGEKSPTLKHAELAKPQEKGSRRSSLSSRRFSANHDSEEKSLAQRIVDLESELEGYKRSEINKVKEESDLQNRVQEALSTKEDLLSNMEAQQREFEGERRLIEHENSRLKIRLEEVEDEFDRVLENNEHDTKMHTLQEELAKARSQASAEVQDANVKLQGLQEDLEAQKRLKEDANQRLQRQKAMNSELQTEVADLTDEKNQIELSWTAFMANIRSCFPNASQEMISSGDREGFLEGVATAVEKQAIRISELEDSERILEYDKDHLQKRFDECEEEIQDLRADIEARDVKLDNLRRDVKTGKEQIDVAIKEKVDLVAKFQETITAHELSENCHNETTERLQRLSSSHEERAQRAQDVSSRLLRHNAVMIRLLEQIGFNVSRQDDTLIFQKASKAPSANSSAVLNESVLNNSRSLSNPPLAGFDGASADSGLASWTSPDDASAEAAGYSNFIREISVFDPLVFAATIVRRVKEADHLARKYIKEARSQREKARRAQVEAHDKIAFKSFKEGDLALFLPTRNQATRPWAAFNIGAPHYFLREQDSHKLRARDWLLARISSVEERVVDLSKTIKGGDDDAAEDRPGSSAGNTTGSDDNPFELSDGLRWYLLDAAEEKTTAPMNIAISKATVAAANVDAKGSIRLKTTPENSDLTKTLARSLDSRRSSTNSKKSVAATAPVANPSDSTQGTTQTPENITMTEGGETLKPPPAPRLDSTTSISSNLSETVQVGQKHIQYC